MSDPHHKADDDAAVQPWSDAQAASLLALTLAQNDVHTLVLADVDGRIRWCNDATERVFGHTRDALVGKHFDVLFKDEDVALGVPQWEQEVTRLRRRAEDDRWMARADGSALYVTGTLHALRDEHGTVLGYAKMMRNRTDAHEHLVAVRNQRDQAQRALDARNQALAQVAHELRSPLSAVAMAATLLRQLATYEDPRTQSLLSSLERQTATMSRMADQLLDAARGEAGMRVAQREPLVLQEAITRAIAQVDGARGRLAQVMLAQPIEVDADPMQMQQVLGNLIENALKYSAPDGKVNVRLSVEGVDAVITVEDEGIGIAPDLQARIFDMFTQVHDAPGTRGFGVGLAVVKQLVALHGGTVQVQSDGLGTGAVFTVRLPLPARTTLDGDDAVQLRSQQGHADGTVPATS